MKSSWGFGGFFQEAPNASSHPRILAPSYLCPLLLLFKGHTDAEGGEAGAEVTDAVGEVVLDAVAVEADADADAGGAHDFLLFGAIEEGEHIGVDAEVMDAVVADVHFPEDAVGSHAGEVGEGGLAARRDMGEQVGMRNADPGGTAAGGVGEQVAAGDGGGAVQILDEAVVKEGNIRAVREAEAGVAPVLQGAELDAAQDADAVGVLFPDQIDVVEIPAQRAFAGAPEIGGGGVLEDVKPAVPDAVIMVGDAEQLQPAGNGCLHDSLRRVLPAKGVIGVGMQVLVHEGCLPEKTRSGKPLRGKVILPRHV